jgi:prophage regulatory protein
MEANMAKRYLKFPALSAKLGGRSRASIHRDMRDRGFPKPINLGPNSVVWDEEEVDTWIEQLKQSKYVPAQVAPGAQKGRKSRGTQTAGGTRHAF